MGWRHDPRRRAVLAVGVLVALLAGLMGWIVVAPESTGVTFPDGRVASEGETRTLPGGGSYAFLQTQADGETPVAYDPCTPVRLVVNERLAPDDADAVLERAVAEVREASGLDHVDDLGELMHPSSPRSSWGPGLDTPDLVDGGSGGEVATGVLMHELAHVLGLDHVDDLGELMHPSSPRSSWGPGDRAGLAALGDAPCAT